LYPAFNILTHVQWFLVESNSIQSILNQKMLSDQIKTPCITCNSEYPMNPQDLPKMSFTIL
jgi:hypothetical protein